MNLLRRGFGHIRNVVRSTLVIYRPEGSALALAPSDLDDLRVLVEPEVARKALLLEWRNNLDGPTPVVAGSVRQATLNLLLNACAATRPGGKITFSASIEGGAVVVEIADTGRGLAPALADYLTQSADAGIVPAEGLGLWIVRRLVVDQGGVIAVSSGETGTSIRVAWPLRAAGFDGDAPATRKELAHAE